MKKSGRFLALLLSILLCMSLFSSCKDKKNGKGGSDDPSGSGSDATSARNLKLCYSTNDYLNPYQAESIVNQTLMPLIYDSLFRVDNTLKPSPLLASGGSVDGLNVTVTLNTNAKFSDGSSMTSSDVVYSFNSAVLSPAYASSLSNFASAVPSSSSSVVFTLKSIDRYALSCLTFAVVKNGSAPVAELSSGRKQQPPIGTGRYYFSPDTTSLTANTSWVGGQKMNINTIELVNVKTSKSISHTLVIGNVDFVFDDLSSGSYSRITAATLDVPQNNLVFLGFNPSTAILQNIGVRTAIFTGLDRSILVSSSYSNHARETSIPFPSDWYGLEESESQAMTYNKSGALELLKANGYEKFSLRLIVNSENSFRLNAANSVKEQLQALNIDVTVTELSWDNYVSSLQNGYYDLYIGEVKLNNNMNLSSFFSAGGTASYGIDPVGTCATAYSQYLNGDISISAFLDTFNSEIPFIPLCYRNGLASFTREMRSNVISYHDDVFYNVHEWNF